MSVRQPKASGSSGGSTSSVSGLGLGVGVGGGGGGSMSKKSSSSINSQYNMRNHHMDASAAAIAMMERNATEDAIFLSDSSTLHDDSDDDDGSGGRGGGGVGVLTATGQQRVAIEQRRRCYMQRSSQRKKYVEPQVMWSRNNIAATMERFEPTPTTPPQLEYGFAAGVVLPPSTAALLGGTPHTIGAAAGVNPASSMSGARHMHAATVHSMPGSPSSSSSLGLGDLLPSATSTTSTPPPSNHHLYSYAYYEPGVAKCHTNIPYDDDVITEASPPLPPAPPPQQAAAHAPTIGAYPGTGSHRVPPPSRHSIRTLLSKTLRARSQSNQPTLLGAHGGEGGGAGTSEDRHTYTTRYGTTENLYEEVSEQQMRKVLSDNRIASGSGAHNIKEELRRVQCNHFRVLDQLNLSLEALIMPPTSIGDSGDGDGGHNAAGANADTASEHAASTASRSASSSTAFQRRGRGGLLGGSLSSFSAASTASSIASSSMQQPAPQQQQQQQRQQHQHQHQHQRDLSHVSSLDNLSNTLHAIELKDPVKSGACHNVEFDEGDLDSGFSGSSSSGASCNESLRYFKTASGTSTSKSSMTSADDNAAQQCIGIGVLTGNRQRR